jgi:glutaconate CoA-transferase, subunit B
MNTRSAPVSAAADYTTKELMAAFVASEIRDDETVSVGASLPVPRAGILLAHLTHAPNLKVQMAFTMTNVRTVEVLEAFELITDWRAARWAEYFYNHDSGPDLYKRRRRAVFFIGGLQIDAYGNTNLIGIGSDFHRLKMRGPGGVGTASMATNIGRYYLWVNAHTKQTLTERLDWRSSYGFGDGGADARSKLHLPGGGPRLCITPLCVFDFDERTRRMRLKSVHPGVTVDEVLANTGFAPIVPKDVPQTPPPTPEQVALLRTRIDVDGVLRR